MPVQVDADALAAAVSTAGYVPDEPVIVGVDAVGERTIVAQGCAAGTVFYAASLAKQVVATAAAVLRQRGLLDIDEPIAQWLPELPTWSRRVKVRHLIHHIGAIPHSNTWQARAATTAYTNDSILHALSQCPELEGTPGTDYRYSSTGYSLLGSILMRAARESLTTWAAREIFSKLGMRDTCLWAGPDLAPPGVTPRIPPEPAPHALGPGGMWTTAADLLQWNRGLATDALGVSAVVHRAGAYDDGIQTDYAWGLGVREHRGQRIYIHGGNLGTINAKLVRWHDSTDSVLVAALDDSTDRWLTLADILTDGVADDRTRSVGGSR